MHHLDRGACDLQFKLLFKFLPAVVEQVLRHVSMYIVVRDGLMFIYAEGKIPRSQIKTLNIYYFKWG